MIDIEIKTLNNTFVVYVDGLNYFMSTKYEECVDEIERFVANWDLDSDEYCVTEN